MGECYNCEFWNSDYEECTCSSYEKWYACPVESEKSENVEALKDYVEWASQEGE